MCHRHGYQEFSWELLPIPASVRAGRDLAEVQLNKWDLSAIAEDVTLIVSELLTNATAASSGTITMRLLLDPESLTVEVSDQSPDRPRRRQAGPDDESGRGLLIVEALTEAWGHRSSADGAKVVWARCRLPGLLTRSP
ncbi:MAG TPA: ATP-binding protein [Spirillospora sp.]